MGRATQTLKTQDSLLITSLRNFTSQLHFAPSLRLRRGELDEHTQGEILGAPSERDSVALELPLRLLVADEGGHAVVTYLSPASLADRFGVPGDLVKNIAGIDKIVDDVVA